MADAIAEALLTGKPFETLVDACRRQAAEVEAAKVLNFAEWRNKLRPREQ